VVLGDIGDAARRQALDQRLHLVDMGGRARLVGRRQAAERRDVGMELVGGRLGDACDRRIERQVGKVARGAGVDLVVDVGDVSRVDDVVSAVKPAQQSEQHVEDNDRPRVADVGEVVDRRPADVHAHGASIDRFELGLAARQRIVESERGRHLGSKSSGQDQVARMRRTGRSIASRNFGQRDASQPAVS